MTVKELIEELKQYDPDKEVRLLTHVEIDDDEYEVGDHIEYVEPARTITDWNNYITIE